MKITYFPETDTLYIELLDIPSVESEELIDGVVVDYSEDGKVVGIEVEEVSAKKEVSLPFSLTETREAES